MRGRGRLPRLSPRCSLTQVRSRFTTPSVTIEFGCSHPTPSSNCCPTPRLADGEPRARRRRRTRARRAVRDAARRLRRGDAARPGTRLPGRGPRRTRRLRDEGVPVGGDAADLRRGGPRRATSRRSASSSSPGGQGIAGDRLVVHGNNKEDELLEQATAAGALIAIDSLDELERTLALGATRLLIRVTPGIEADTHEAVKTAHHGSKFGLPPDDALEAIRLAPATEGLHVHVGSQLMHFGASLMTVDWIAGFAARARAELGWTPRIDRPRRRPRRAARARGAGVLDRRVRRRPRRRVRRAHGSCRACLRST